MDQLVFVLRFLMSEIIVLGFYRAFAYIPLTILAVQASILTVGIEILILFDAMNARLFLRSDLDLLSIFQIIETLHNLHWTSK